jgi:ABC-type bacteriocin/lantibiotic exporter with double-glycine peptidase domain
MTIRGLTLVVLAAAAGCATWGTAPVQQEPGWVTVAGARAHPQQGPRDCGAAALTTVLGRFDPALRLEEVRRLTGPPDADGLSAARLREVARARGLQAFLFSGSLDDVDRELEAGRPVLVGVVRAHGRKALAHYQVIAGRQRNGDRLLVADPERGWTVISRQDFLTEWERARRLTLVVSR